MQFKHDFEISPVKYFLNGKDNDFPEVDTCPHCKDKMIKNGFYKRYVITFFGKTYILYIRRYRCVHCNKTISILPSFLLPYYQRSLQLIFMSLYNYLIKRRYILNKRQVLLYYSRFRKNLPGIICYIREKTNLMFVLGEEGKEKAIKIIKMIKSFPTPAFSQRYHNHFNKDFMAL